MPPIGATPPPIRPQASVATAPTQQQSPMGTLQRAGGQRDLLVQPQPAKPSLISRMGQSLSSGFKNLKNYMASIEMPRLPRARGAASPAQAAPAKMSLDELKAARAAYPKAAELAEFKQQIESRSGGDRAAYLMSLPKDGLVRTEYLKFAEQKMLAENINFLTALEEGQDFESLYENFINPPNDNAASPFAESKPGLNLSAAAKEKAESAMATLEIALNLPGGDGEIVSHARQGCDDALAMCKSEIMSQLGQALSAGSNSDFLKTPLFAESPYQPVAEPRRPMTAADFDGTKGAQRSERGNAQGATPSHRPEPAVVRPLYNSLTDPARKAEAAKVTADRVEARKAEAAQVAADLVKSREAEAAPNIASWKQAIISGGGSKIRELIHSPNEAAAHRSLKQAFADQFSLDVFNFIEAVGGAFEVTDTNTNNVCLGKFKGGVVDAQNFTARYIVEGAPDQANIDTGVRNSVISAMKDLATAAGENSGNVPADHPAFQAFSTAVFKAERVVLGMATDGVVKAWRHQPTPGLD